MWSIEYAKQNKSFARRVLPDIYALQERLAKANSEIAQLERVLSNVGTKSVGTLVPDNADLIYQYLTMNKGGWGIPVSRSIITFEAANIISNILAHTPHGVIEKPIHTNKNVWKADEHYYTGHELINKDLGILQRGISDAATSSPLATPNLFPMVKNPVSNYFLNDMAIEAIQKAVQKGVKK